MKPKLNQIVFILTVSMVTKQLWWNEILQEREKCMSQKCKMDLRNFVLPNIQFLIFEIRWVFVGKKVTWFFYYCFFFFFFPLTPNFLIISLKEKTRKQKNWIKLKSNKLEVLKTLFVVGLPGGGLKYYNIFILY